MGSIDTSTVALSFSFPHSITQSSPLSHTHACTHTHTQIHTHTHTHEQVRAGEKKEEVVHLESECARREAQLHKDKETLEQQLRATATEVQALEEMVANGTSTGKARLQIARKKVEDLERDVKEATYAASRRRTARTDTLMALCNNAAQHKLNVQDRLKELESKCVDLQSQIATS